MSAALNQLAAWSHPPQPQQQQLHQQHNPLLSLYRPAIPRNGIEMKRQGDNDYGRDYPKRQKNLSGDGYADALANGKFELRLLVGSKAAGAIIGKGGENIKRLRTSFDATISVPDSSSPERVLTMTSTIESLIDILRDILPRIDEANHATAAAIHVRSDHRLEYRGDFIKKEMDDKGSKGRDGGDGGKQEARMLVHQSHAGALIGRGGSKIKELRESTRANIKVFSHCAPMSTDRVVLLSGDDNAIADAVKTIIELIRDIPIKGQTKQYDTINYDPSLVPEYGGHGAPLGARFSNGGGGGGPPGGMYGGRGGGEQQHRGPPHMGGGPPPMGGPGGFPGSHMAPPMGGGFGMTAGPVSTTQVTIPSELGGTIIGRGGERINRIREESGAHIVLEPPNGQEIQERIITITGTQTQIHAAQYLLQQCVRTSIAGRKYIGESGR